MPNAVGAVQLELKRERELYSFVAIHDFTYWLCLLHDITAAVSLRAIGTAKFGLTQYVMGTELLCIQPLL